MLKRPTGSPAGVLFSMGRSPTTNVSQLVWRTDGVSITNPANIAEELQLFAKTLSADVWSMEVSALQPSFSAAAAPGFVADM